MKTNQYTAPLTTPGMLMKSKYKILLPSFKTRPRGRKSVSVRIKPPKLFQHKWYTQQDLCSVPLVQLNVTAADMQHPFGSPLTDTPCVSFQVLGDLYNNCLNIDLPQFNSSGTISTSTSYQRENKTQLEELYKTLFTKQSSGHFWQTFLTNTMVKAHIDAEKAQKAMGGGTTQTTYNTTPFPTVPTADQFNNWKPKFTDQRDSNFLFATYHPDQIKETIKEMRDNNFKLETGPNDKYGQYQAQYSRNTHMLDYYLGFYSPIFLSSGRSNVEFFTAYRDIVYNPLLDKATGNQLWFQYHTKFDNNFRNPECHWEIEDMPLWALCNGYKEYLESQIKYGDILVEGKVLIRCPYTSPPLVDKNDPTAGFVVYNENFGKGKWIDGEGYIPLHERSKWYVMLRYQTDVLHDIVTCGPWQYRDDEKNSQLVAKYYFRFKWGGNVMHSQVIRNPCPDHQVSGPRRQPREVQVVDPQLITPPWVLHTFDQRRGLFTETALRRLLKQPLPGEYDTQPPKGPTPLSTLRIPTRRRRCRKRLRFTGQKTPVLVRREPDAEPLLGGGPGGDDEGAPPAKAPRAASTPVPTPAVRAPTRQDPGESPRKPPIILPAINKVFLFPPNKPTPIQGYHGWNTEFEACQAFDRPPESTSQTHLPTPGSPSPILK